MLPPVRIAPEHMETMRHYTRKLAAALSDPDPRVRQIAAEALGRFGSLAASAEPALSKALDDSNADVRKAASDALLSILQAGK